MMLLKRLNVINNIKTTDTTDLILKTDYNANINKFKIKLLLIMIMINILLLRSSKI